MFVNLYNTFSVCLKYFTVKKIWTTVHTTPISVPRDFAI